MIRALHPPGATGAALYVSVGGVTNLAVAVGATCVFTRVAAHGTQGMASELAERRGLTFEHAHAWMKHVGLTAAVEEIEGDQDIVAAARVVLEDGAARIADELRTSLDFYAVQDAASSVERAILTGAAAEIPGFCELLSKRADLPLEVGVLREAQPGALGGIHPSRLVVATGLTMGEAPA
jgi:type IV pilus assembly protein PilM